MRGWGEEVGRGTKKNEEGRERREEKRENEPASLTAVGREMISDRDPLSEEGAREGHRPSSVLLWRFEVLWSERERKEKGFSS